MDASDESSASPSGLPPPPASPAARTYSSQGIDARPFARSHTELAGHMTPSQARLNNIAIGAVPPALTAADEGMPAYYCGDEFDLEGHKHQPGEHPPQAPTRRPPNVTTNTNTKRTTTKVVKPLNVKVVPVRSFSTAAAAAAGPTISTPITSSTSSETIKDQIAAGGVNTNQPALDFHPHPSTGYTFSAPQAPPTFRGNTDVPTPVEQTESPTPESSPAATTIEPPSNETSGSPQQSASPSPSSSSSSFVGVSSPASTRSLFPSLHFSELPQAFSVVESILTSASSTPSKLVNELSQNLPRVLKNVQSNLPNPEQLVGSIQSAVMSGAASRIGGSAASSASRKPTKAHILGEILRVDHAGEYGAQRIHDGQLAAMAVQAAIKGAFRQPTTKPINDTPAHKDDTTHTTDATSVPSSSSSSSPSDSTADLVSRMRAQEAAHLRTFDRLLPSYRVRPSALLPVWNVVGFGLGATSAMMGSQTALACTLAVDQSMTRHYNEQIRTLSQHGFEEHAELKAIIKQHRDEEEQNRAIAIEQEASKAPAYGLITNAIQAGCQAAIWITKRV